MYDREFDEERLPHLPQIIQMPPVRCRSMYWSITLPLIFNSGDLVGDSKKTARKLHLDDSNIRLTRLLSPRMRFNLILKTAIRPRLVPPINRIKSPLYNKFQYPIMSKHSEACCQ